MGVNRQKCIEMNLFKENSMIFGFNRQKIDRNESKQGKFDRKCGRWIKIGIEIRQKTNINELKEGKSDGNLIEIGLK